MIITLFLLPALLPLSCGVVVPHQLSSSYAAEMTEHVTLDPRNKPPVGYVPEDLSDGVNLAATDGPGGEDDEECEEDGSDDETQEVNLAATDGTGEDEDCEEGDDDDVPAEVNLAATGPASQESTKVNNVAVGQEKSGGGINVGVPVTNGQAGGGGGGGSGGTENAQQSPAEGDTAVAEVNNVAVGQGGDGGGVSVSVPMNNPQAGGEQGGGGEQAGSATMSQEHQSRPAPSAQPTDKSTDEEAKDNSGNQGGNTNAEVRVGTGWDTKHNKADLSTWIAGGLQWWYEWTLQPTFKDVNIEFIPMVWGPDDVPKVKEAMTKWPDSIKHVFSFNEPDIKDGQAGQYLKSTKEAVELHNQISETLGDKYKLSTPSVSTGLGWLEEWDTECKTLTGSPCRYDFVAYHFYGTDPQDLIDTIEKLHDRFGKKVWVTEYGCHVYGDYPHTCSSEEADHLMKTTVEWFKANPDIVERWAWFGAFGDMKTWLGKYDMDANRIANADGTVSDKGKTYLSM